MLLRARGLLVVRVRSEELSTLPVLKLHCTCSPAMQQNDRKYGNATHCFTRSLPNLSERGVVPAYETPLQLQTALNSYG